MAKKCHREHCFDAARHKMTIRSGDDYETKTIFVCSSCRESLIERFGEEVVIKESRLPIARLCERGGCIEEAKGKVVIYVAETEEVTALFLCEECDEDFMSEFGDKVIKDEATLAKIKELGYGV